MRGNMPVPFGEVDSSSKVRRHVLCLHYGRCLDHAVKNNWTGFSCERCRSYEQEHWDAQRMRMEHERCMALAYACGAWRLDH